MQDDAGVASTTLAVDEVAVKALIDWATEEVRLVRGWWKMSWWSHLWMVSGAYLLAIMVPFGLAALLYFVEPTRTQLLLVTLVCSCISLVLQVLDNVLRQKDRADHFEALYTDLNHSLALFRSGQIDVDAFREATELARDRRKIDMGHV